MSKGIASKKDLDAFVMRMANGRKVAAASRASSNAPPSVPAKPKRAKAAAPNPPSPNANTVIGQDTKIPAPAKSKGRGASIVINIGKEYC